MQRSLTGGVHQITCPRLSVHATDSIGLQQQTVERPLAPDNGSLGCHPRPADVFVCHSGCTEGDGVKLLEHVRTELQNIPLLGGGAVNCALRQGDDDGPKAVLDLVQIFWQAAICQAPIGAFEYFAEPMFW